MSLFLVNGGLGVVMVLNEAPDKRVQFNIWARFVHRLRSSLSAFRFHSSVAAHPASPPNEGGSMQSAQMEDVLYPSRIISDSSDSQMLSAATHEMRSENEHPVMTGLHVRYGTLRSAQGRQRLAGRATRIRLEGVPTSSSENIPEQERSYWEFKNTPYAPCEDPPSHVNVSANARTPAAPAFHAYNDTTDASMTFPALTAFDNKSGTSAYIPAVGKVSRRSTEDRAFANGDRRTTDMRLPAMEKVSRRPVEDRTFADGDRRTTDIRLPAVEKGTGRRNEPSPTWRVGTGEFECGQRDVTITEPSVTASSVVLVTLTADPGPVVVQYVSLQPGRGFTVHLTAPTTIGAPFNYVVLGV